MKNLLKLLPLAAMVLATQASASSQTGYITSFYIDSGGRLLFYMSGDRGPTPPSCAYNDGRWELIPATTSAAGQLQVAALLTAQATHQLVLVSGTNDCRVADSETVGYFKINP